MAKLLSALGTAIVPADSNLAIAQTAADTHWAVSQNDLMTAGTLGTVTASYNLSGTDNITDADSRLRYYVYQGSSATAKGSAQRGTTVTVTGATANNDDNFTMTCCPLDTRFKQADNITLTITASGISDSAMASGTPYIMVYPGNEAGDAASGVSAAILDRGYGYALSGSNTRSAILLGADTTSGSTSFYVAAHSHGGILAEAIETGRKLDNRSCCGRIIEFTSSFYSLS
jgi:hypothetical protein